MSLDFFAQDDLLIETIGYLDCLEAAEYLGSLEMQEFDKLEPCWKLCRQQSLIIGDYYSDMLLKSCDVAVVLTNLRNSYGLIATRKPFVSQREPETDAYNKIVKMLELAYARQVGVIAVCD